jgi:hypothetical protein
VYIQAFCVHDAQHSVDKSVWRGGFRG